MLVVADIEADSLDPTKLWLIGVKEIDTGKVTIFRRPDLDPKPFRDYAKKVSGWVFHNGLDYDLPVIHKFIGEDVIQPTEIIDTLVVSRLLNFNREGGHSLRALGAHLGIHKKDFTDFENYSEEMVEYLEGDLEVGEAVFNMYKDYITED
jgi:DNA polymerase-1